MKKTSYYKGIFVMAFLMFFFVVASRAQAASIKLSKTSVTLSVKQKKTLKVTGTSKKVKWSSSDTSVATVSNSGLVKAKAVGSATITAKVGSKKFTCTVKVKGDYRELYAEFLSTKATSKYPGYFYVLDVNKDGLPELIYMDSGSVYQYVYTIVKGEVTLVGELNFSGASKGYVVTYNKKQKALYRQSLSYGSGGASYGLCRISSKNKLTYYKTFYEAGSSYTINEKSVSKSTFQKQLKKYCGSSVLKEYTMLQNTSANRSAIE